MCQIFNKLKIRHDEKLYCINFINRNSLPIHPPIACLSPLWTQALSDMDRNCFIEFTVLNYRYFGTLLTASFIWSVQKTVIPAQNWNKCIHAQCLSAHLCWFSSVLHAYSVDSAQFNFVCTHANKSQQISCMVHTLAPIRHWTTDQKAVTLHHSTGNLLLLGPKARPSDPC